MLERMNETTPAVRAEGLVKTFGDQRAVDHVDLEVRRGEVFGVLGPNGAGKTTMLKMLATLLPIDGGRAEIFGHDVRREPHVVRQLLGVTGQYASVDENLTATENLLLFARLQGVAKPTARVDRGDACSSSSTSTEAASKPISAFSGGMRRRLDLAASLITRPPLIFLDEPTTGLDPRTRGQMWDTIRELVAQRLHGAAHHAVPRRGRPAGRPDRGHRPRRQGRRGHLRRAEDVGRSLDPAAAAGRRRRSIPAAGRVVERLHRRAAGALPRGAAAHRAAAAQRPGRRRPGRAARAAASPSTPSTCRSRRSTRCSWPSPATTPASTTPTDTDRPHSRAGGRPMTALTTALRDPAEGLSTRVGAARHRRARP